MKHNIPTDLLGPHSPMSRAVRERIEALLDKAEVRGASKAADVINKEIGVEMTLDGHYYILRGSE